ncbi:unnamed protein product [Calypogeia fissa]
MKYEDDAVEELSGGSDIDSLNTVDETADHIYQSQPETKNSPSFHGLVNFIHEIMGKYQNVFNQALRWQFNEENPPARVLKISLNDLAIKVLDASDDLRNLDLDDERRCIYGTPLCEWVILTRKGFLCRVTTASNTAMFEF